MEEDYGLPNHDGLFEEYLEMGYFLNFFLICRFILNRVFSHI
jgi:hypothetical protein